MREIVGESRIGRWPDFAHPVRLLVRKGGMIWLFDRQIVYPRNILKELGEFLAE